MRCEQTLMIGATELGSVPWDVCSLRSVAVDPRCLPELEYLGVADILPWALEQLQAPLLQAQ